MYDSTGIRAAKKLLDDLPSPACRAAVWETAKDNFKKSRKNSPNEADWFTWYEAVNGAILSFEEFRGAA